MGRLNTGALLGVPLSSLSALYGMGLITMDIPATHVNLSVFLSLPHPQPHLCPHISKLPSLSLV